MYGAPGPGGYGPPGAGAYTPPPNSMQGMPVGFDSGTNLAGNGINGQNQQNLMNPALGPQDAQGGQSQNAGPLPLIEEMDLSIQCNPMFMRATVGKIVNSQSQATQSRLPLGIVCRPMCGDKGINNEDIEVVDFGSTGIVRCKRCRTHINSSSRGLL